jgi:TolB-like protein/outer membrane protein W
MYRFIIITAALISISFNTAAAADTYAVMGYEMKEKASADKIADFVAKRLNKRTGSKVISHKEAAAKLKQQKCTADKYQSARKYCQAAGRVLAADYLVYGKAWRSGDDIIVESHMIQTSTGNRVGHALAQENPKDKMLFSEKIDSSVAELLKHHTTVASAGSKSQTSIGGSSDSSWHKYKVPPAIQTIMDHVEIGLRISRFSLLDNTEKHFNDDGEFAEGYLGSISKLDAEQDYFPTIYANVTITDWFALQLAYEKFEIGTVTYWDGHKDGTFKFKGPSLTAQLRYPNETEFTPYAGIGIAMLNADFAMVDWWHNGFGGDDPEGAYDNWVQSGAPRWPNGGYQRNLIVTDGTMFKPVLQGGCYWSITDHISLDLDMRYISLDSELHYTLSNHGNVFSDRGVSDFPMDAWIIDLGILFSF